MLNRTRQRSCCFRAYDACALMITFAAVLVSCGRPKYRLPPIGSDLEPSAVVAGMPNADEPAMPALVAAYIRGHSGAAYRSGSLIACFSDLGPPCGGNVVDLAGKVRQIAVTDICSYSNPTGKAHLVIADSNFQVYFDAQFALPSTFSSIPTEIGDETSKLVFDEVCSL